MTTDPELASLIRETIEAGFIKVGSREHEVALAVAERGQKRLSSDERRIWEWQVLPIISKPLRDQLLIDAVRRRGGRLPRSLVA